MEPSQLGKVINRAASPLPGVELLPVVDAAYVIEIFRTTVKASKTAALAIEEPQLEVHTAERSNDE